MSFVKFRLENTTERSTPVPIAAAVSQPSSKRQNDNVQYDSPKRSRGRASSDERLPSAPSAIHAGQWCQFGRGSACVECKISKTRCDKSPTVADDKCRRCLRQNKECVRYSSARPSHVEHSGKSSDHSSEEGVNNINFNSETDPSTAFSMGLTETNAFSDPSSRTWAKQLNNKIDSIVTPETAEEIFLQYVTKFAPKCPIVAFPPGTTSGSLRTAKPFLYLSILSVACAAYCPLSKQRELELEVKSCLADTAIVRGEKSIELVQALQVVSFWYRASDTYTQMILNQLASISVTMAMDLGLDSLNLASKAQDNWHRAEAERAWLSCFLLCASLSLILRRPNSSPYFTKLEDYISDLQLNNISPTDAFLCKLVTVELLCHTIDQELCLSSPAQAVSAPSPNAIAKIQNIQHLIDGQSLDQFHHFERSLSRFGEFASLLYLHELALHVNNNIDEFKAPFSANSLKTCNFLDSRDSSRMSRIHAIISASQGLLDIFLEFSISDMLTLPPHIYGGRVIYAIILLMKIHKAIVISKKEASGIIQPGSLRLEVYLEQLVIVSKRLMEEDQRSALSRAFLMMPQLMKQFKTLPKADENPILGSILTNTGNRSDTASLLSTVTPGGSSIAIEGPETNSTSDNSRPLDGSECQVSGPIQPATSPYPPFTHSEDNSFGTSGSAMASDTWFWEFFNIEMLN